jgi:hypothetical protein
LLKKRVRRPVRGGEKHDSPDMLSNPVQGSRGGGARSDPHEEYRIDAVKASIERVEEE